MPNIVHLSDFSGLSTLTTDENYFLAEGVTHYASTGIYAIRINDDGRNDIFIAGSLVMFSNGNAIGGNSTTDAGTNITISSSGSIFGPSDYRAIGLDADRTTINNAGFLAGGEVIRLDGDDNRIINSGTIQNSFNNSNTPIHAVAFTGNDALLDNSGTISGASGVTSTSNLSFTNTGTLSAHAVALQLFNTGVSESFIVNHGTITSTDSLAIDAADGVEKLINTGTISGGIDMDGGADRIENSGTIIGTVDIGLFELGDDVIVNSGTIIGDVFMSTTENLLRNSGNISGDIFMSNGNDTLINSGEIQGEVDLGTGDDVFNSAGTGTVSGTVLGGTGNDTIRGAESDDVISGDDNDDLIFGNSGEDTLFGGSGEDNIRGGADDDLVDGGSGDDNLRGDGGDDVLYGGDDDDKIFGGSGDDEIIGGTGKDVMRGNSGADTFVFLTEFDANTTDAIDRIRDFEQGIDMIDISAIASFDFIGDASFSGTGSEVRYQTTASGLRFEMDVDGDGVADMRINVNSISELLESDFLL